MINNANKKCIEEILKNTSYKNYEILAIGNLEERAENDKVKIINTSEKNYSKLINDCVKNIKDVEYLVIFDGNSLILTSNWIEKMLGFAR